MLELNLILGLVQDCNFILKRIESRDEIRHFGSISSNGVREPEVVDETEQEPESEILEESEPDIKVVDEPDPQRKVSRLLRPM